LFRVIALLEQRSMAGETEQVPSIMHKLMHIHAIEDSGSPLLHTDEVDADQEQQAGEDDPRQDFANRNCDRGRDGKRLGYGHNSGSLISARFGFTAAPGFILSRKCQSAERQKHWQVQRLAF
jgi:hypothetical protein